MNIDSKKISSIVISIAFIAGGIYMYSKHKNEAGFWSGVLALFLFVSYMKWDNNAFTFNFGGLLKITAEQPVPATPPTVPTPA